MMKAIETAFDIAPQKAFEQSQRTQPELSAAADALTVGKVQFESDIKIATATAKTAAQMRADAAAYEQSLHEAVRIAEEAEAQRNEAVCALDSDMTQLTGLLMARQISDGEIVTGLTGAEPKCPKLVKASAHD